jgi:hypothetical protein
MFLPRVCNRVQLQPGVTGIAPISFYQSMYMEAAMAWSFTSYPPVYTMEVYAIPPFTEIIPYSNITSWVEWSQNFWSEYGCGLLKNGTIWCPPYKSAVEGVIIPHFPFAAKPYQRMCVTADLNQGTVRA